MLDHLQHARRRDGGTGIRARLRIARIEARSGSCAPCRAKPLEVHVLGALPCLLTPH